jgi:nicotinamide-nucleotide amidase
VAGAICNISGASDVFERGFVTYTNRAKSEMLGVPGDLIADHGAVSEVVARWMAEGALEASNAHVAVSITGVAGPGGGSPLKPVGTVHFAVARANRSVVHRHELFDGETREGVQLAAVRTALEMLREAVA